MNFIDYLFLCGFGMTVAGIVIGLVRGKKNGQSGCGRCSQRAHCAEKPFKIDNDSERAYRI